MITEKELKLVDELRAKQNRLKSALNSFDSQYVKTVVGLVSVNAASSYSVDKSDHSDFFQTELAVIRDELTVLAKAKLSHSLKEIELELSKYIGEPA